MYMELISIGDFAFANTYIWYYQSVTTLNLPLRVRVREICHLELENCVVISPSNQVLSPLSVQIKY